MLNHNDLRDRPQRPRNWPATEAETATTLLRLWAGPNGALSERGGLPAHPGFSFRRTDPRGAVLRDGSVVLIRRVNASDAPLLVDGFSRLSEQSRRMRFLFAKKVLTSAELGYLTEVDHRDHEALGALEQNTGTGVGIARYIRDDNNPCSAEVAVTVVDDWQNRGLGTELVSRLSARAREEGIHRFTALVTANNVQATSMLRRFSATLIRRTGHDVEYEIPLNLHHPGRTALACR